MSIEQRSHFRIDVEIAFFLEPQDSSGHCIHVHKDDLLSNQQLTRLKMINSELTQLFSHQKHIENGAVELFSEIHSKLKVMTWLLDAIVEGGEVLERVEYHQMLEHNDSLKLRDNSSSSKVFPLLEAYYERVESYTAELISVAEKSIHGKLFMYQIASPQLFDSDQFIKGLPALAEKGNWLAKVISLLVEKLNIYETLLINLKQAYRELSNHQAWPICRVNLAVDGFSVFIEKTYRPGDLVCCLFKLDDEFVFCRATCVYQQEADDSKQIRRTAFKCSDISAEDEAHIVRFMTSKELESRNKDFE